MRNRSKARFVNSVVAAVIAVFFLVHGILGCTAIVFGHMSSFVWVVWVAMALVAVHVVASIVTSREQLTDGEWLRIFEEAGSLEYARKYAESLTKIAKNRLYEILPPSTSRDLLFSMADWFVTRLS